MLGVLILALIAVSVGGLVALWYFVMRDAGDID